MKTFERQAVLVSLMRKLRDQGSWCGETHIQKACYLLQTLTNVNLGVEFVLYKHGPYSFDIADDLSLMKGLGYLTVLIRQPYGPSLIPSKECQYLDRKFVQLIQQVDSDVTRIAETVKDSQVKSLEKIATALFVKRKMPQKSVVEQAEYIHMLKPHIEILSAKEALDKVSEIEGRFNHWEEDGFLKELVPVPSGC
jgi:uncharacterized protein YwgA